MNFLNLLGLIYFGLHLVVGIFGLILWEAVFCLQQLGDGAWIVAVICLGLAASDWKGRISLSEPLGRLAAAMALPFLWGMTDVLVREKLAVSTPAMWGGMLAMLLLDGYLLLREKPVEEPLDRAVALLERGSGLGVVELIWLHLLGIVCVLVLTFGLWLAVFIGALLAGTNGLLDYSGVRGWLAGFLLLHLLQSAYFLRGTRLARRAVPGLETGPLPALVVPVWNQIQAGRLECRLRTQRWPTEY